MSQENRDERLGLTGLTPEQRKQRLDELGRELAEKQRVAAAKLQAARARMATAQDLRLAQEEPEETPGGS